MSDRVLGWALRPTAATGSNLRGQASGAGWLYATPGLSVGRTVCVGAPSVAALAGLARVSATVVVVEADPRRRRRITATIERRGWSGVRVVSPSVHPPAGDVDVLVLSPMARGRWCRATWARYLDRLAAEGITYGLPDTRRWRRLAPAGGGVLPLRLKPGVGEPYSIVPRDDTRMQATLRSLGLEGTVSRRPKPARLERRIGRWVAVPARHVLLTGPFTGSEKEVPRYLRRLAIAAGVDLSGWSWGVVARGEYDSQKVLVLLTPPGHTRPTGLVKLTRSAKYVDRLDNEERALRALTELPTFSDRVPAPWFAGRHGGRAVLGQSALSGSPFSANTRWNADCVLLQDCLTALGDLAASTVSFAAASDVADALAALIDRYEQIYAPPDAESGALREQLAMLAALPGPLPVVLQHGDPHPGNLLVSAAGRTLFLDWESADPRGMPLWDILYFFRSYAAAASKREGLRDQVRGAARHMVDGSPLGDRLVAAVHREAVATGLPRDAIGPLIHACWVHHALKEATRMPHHRLDQAPSARLLRTMLAQPRAGTLGRLTEPGC